MNVFNCAECTKSLSALDIKHGWKTVYGARVHTICISAWMDRTSHERDLKVKAVK